jgi:hypothetical protein
MYKEDRIGVCRARSIFNNSSKKGQVTVFMIVGILVLAVSIFIFYISSLSVAEISQSSKETLFDTSSVELFVQSCLEDTIDDAIFSIAQQGGFYELPRISTQEAFLNAPYYLYLGDIFIPDTIRMQDNIKFFIEENMQECHNFTIFPSFEIQSQLPQVEVTLTENRILAELDLSIIISQDNRSKELDSFIIEKDSRLLELANIAREITATQQEHNELVCISCLALLGLQHNVEILTVDSDEGTLFSIFDREYDPDTEGEEFSFRFFHKYYEDEQ